MMKTWLLAMMVSVVGLAFVAEDVQAKRLGGGKSSGMQRDMPAKTAPDAPPAKPATPAQQQATNPATAGAPAAAAAPAKRSWLGPIAGLAAGLGLAALMSHMGLGEGFANVLMIILLAAAAFFLIRWVMRRMSPQPAAATMTPRAGAPAQVAWPTAAAPAEPGLEAPAAAAASAAPAVAKAFVPASFDNEAFERAAKLIFIRLQAANDAGDLEDLRSFTTPEMFATARLELQERGGARQQTDVLRVDAQVLDVAQDADRQIVSVRFHGELREEAGAAPAAFNEVWHLTKPLAGDESRGWAVAGIEQLN